VLGLLQHLVLRERGANLAPRSWLISELHIQELAPRCRNTAGDHRGCRAEVTLPATMHSMETHGKPWRGLALLLQDFMPRGSPNSCAWTGHSRVCCILGCADDMPLHAFSRQYKAFGLLNAHSCPQQARLSCIHAKCVWSVGRRCRSIKLPVAC
jgi:hypothetical protein